MRGRFPSPEVYVFFDKEYALAYRGSYLWRESGAALIAIRMSPVDIYRGKNVTGRKLKGNVTYFGFL